MKKGFILNLLMLLFPLFVEGKNNVYDTPMADLHQFFGNANTTYVVRYKHVFRDTQVIPSNSVLKFDGGSLTGPIRFNSTMLKGSVNLKGSRISGNISNKEFDASWFCAMDGIEDDAQNINEMIAVCGNVYFPKGTYRLISRYDPSGVLKGGYRDAVNSHIGINRSNVVLRGDQGAEFLTNKVLGTITIFTTPKYIENSIHDIEIRNLGFRVANDGVNFHEFFHVIKVIGVRGLKIVNCTFDDYWGDAIYLAHYGDTPKTGERSRNQNVEILYNTITGEPTIITEMASPLLMGRMLL